MHRPLAAALLALPAPALAWHDTIEGGLQSSGGGVPLGAIIPLVVAVIAGGVALAIWGRKPAGKPHRRRRGRR
ncbi:MAG TPA: hypothetical protein VHG92_09995 [Afifellaceae bacterium]|nr:hypothetical protein [Afifellaceae bacterium]